MVKITPKNIMRVLRLYGIADENASVRSFRNVEIISSESFVRASLAFEQVRYVILLGSTVDEDTVDDLWPGKPEDVTPLENPLEPGSHSTPFQGKYLMLFRLSPIKQRLDVYLSSRFDGSISRSLWQKYIKSGYVKVNDEVVLSPKTDIQDTDSIAVDFPPEQPQAHEIPVLYQDEDVLVINKPAGILTHAKGGIANEFTVADFFAPHTTFGAQADRAGIVHRLDRDTSGVLIGAKHPEAAKQLQQQFASRKTKKLYLAVVEGVPKLSEAVIDLPIARHPSKPSTFRVDPKGKSAQTTYRVIASANGRSLIQLEPRTGRTHQLRVHMAHLGTPIAGDRVYGKKSERLMLHAHKLELVLPDGSPKTFTSAVPEEFLAGFEGVEL